MWPPTPHLARNGPSNAALRVIARYQRPSLELKIDRCRETLGAEWRQVWRRNGVRSATHDIRSPSVFLATASWMAHDKYWPRPVRLRVLSAAIIVKAICSPAMA